MFTIGQVSKMFHLPISTLRYYDKEGLFPNIQRASGIRKFSDAEIEALHVIDCLKSSGMEIKDIKQFMEWCQEGPSTYLKRKEMFERQKKVLEKELQELEKHMAMIQFKCWYYEQAITDGNEDHIKEMMPEDLPEEIQALYDRSRGSHEAD
ncbi:MAG: MerR family transcriptional regulator [Hespellia sp.]|nr:MerR family transcriptional regulator [Hespellia sp.]